MDLWGWVDDFNNSVKRGAKDWSKDPLGETGKAIWNAVNGNRSRPIDTYNKATDYFGDTHPETEEQFRHQQLLGSIPVVGGWYSDYMRNQSLMEQQANWRNDFGVEWGDTKYPWLSSMWSANPGASLVGSASSAGVKISKNLKKLYE